MHNFKTRWEIQKNWQLIHPFLGVLALVFCGYTLAKVVLSNFSANNTILLVFLTFILSYGILNVTLKLFNSLEKKWNITYRWELIAIFLVFAITGSSAAKLSGPLVRLLHLHEYFNNPFLFWTIRLLIVFPIYQALLVVIGWFFGQFNFFWNFEKKMLRRLGFKTFFND